MKTYNPAVKFKTVCKLVVKTFSGDFITLTSRVYAAHTCIDRETKATPRRICPESNLFYSNYYSAFDAMTFLLSSPVLGMNQYYTILG